MIKRYAAVGGMRIARESDKLKGNQPKCHTAHHEPHTTCPSIEYGAVHMEM